MKYAEVIIIGGGPAGSSCAWKLLQHNMDCLILDAHKFPRTKLCAGWITPQVIEQLELEEYPDIQINANEVTFFGITKKLRSKSHAIRRVELDHWLLKRSGVEVHEHKVYKIIEHNGFYIIDDKYKCKYLIGAGGTNCPVYHTFFKKAHPRNKDKLVCALEQEIKYDYEDKVSRTWFYENNFHGYSWCIAKKGGYLNIGVGGIFKKKKVNIKAHWTKLVEKLDQLDIVKNFEFKPKGYLYYIRDRIDHCRIGNAFIVGDAAGLATIDIGEGIGPAVESAFLAADAIINNTQFSLHTVTKRSNPVSMRIMHSLWKLSTVFRPEKINSMGFL